MTIRILAFRTLLLEVERRSDDTYPSKPMTQPYQRVSKPRTRFTSSLPFSAGGFRITSGSAFSQARPRAWMEEGSEVQREGEAGRCSVVD